MSNKKYIRVTEKKPDLIEIFRATIENSEKFMSVFIDPNTEEVFISIFDGDYRTFTLDKEAAESMLGSLSSSVG